MDWNGPAGMGDGGPTVLARVKLIKEDLSLKMGSDPNGYDVEARYVLSNPGAPATVSYVVPLTWSSPDEGQADEDALKKAAASVKIELEGASRGCALKKVEGSPQTVAVPDDSPVPVGAWCVTRLTVPTGDAVALTLRYHAGMTYMDGETSKSAIPSYDVRRLVYPLFPAGGWGGKPAMTVRFDAGIWADDTKILTPRGFAREGSVYSWSSPAADLEALSAIIARVDASARLEHQYLTATNTKDDVFAIKLSARSSSALQGDYGTDQLLDGKAETAWCEGADGDGVGEWVELTVAKPTGLQHCQMQGLVIVPGYAKNQAIYTGNGRVSAVEVAPCGQPGELVHLDVSSRHDESARVIPLEWADPEPLRKLGVTAMEDPDQFCVRLTLREVQKGSKYSDTCISELAGLVACG